MRLAQEKSELAYSYDAAGILSHVEGKRYEVMQALSSYGEINQGDTFALDDIYRGSQRLFVSDR